MKIDAPIFKKAMRQCAGAVALVTVGTEPGRRTGLTVTSACSLSDNPPSLLVASTATPALTAASVRNDFRGQLSGEDHVLLALTFSGQKGVNGDDRFAFGRWTENATGGPVLEDAAAAFDCTLAQEFESKTHSIFIGEIRDARISAEGEPAHLSPQRLQRRA